MIYIDEVKREKSKQLQQYQQKERENRKPTRNIPQIAHTQSTLQQFKMMDLSN